MFNKLDTLFAIIKINIITNIMLKILIVEDEQVLLTKLSDKLNSTGFDVIEAKDGKDGLKKALKEQSNLILLDLLMPRMDGVTMLTELRESGDYGKDVDVLVLTNLEPNNEVLSNMTMTQPVYYLIKSDTSLEEVCTKIREITSGSPLSDSN